MVIRWACIESARPCGAGKAGRIPCEWYKMTGEPTAPALTEDKVELDGRAYNLKKRKAQDEAEENSG